MTDDAAGTSHSAFPAPARREQGLAVSGVNTPCAAADYPPLPPSLACHHCGAVIGLVEWPPLEPLLSGPCPGCGGWLVVDLAMLAARHTAAAAVLTHNAVDESGADEENEISADIRRPEKRLVRSGSFEPRFLPNLAAAGLLPQPWHPEFEKPEASLERVFAEYYVDRWMRFWTITAALVALVAGGIALRQYLRSKPSLSAAKQVDGKPAPPDHGAESFPLPEEMAAEARTTLEALAAARSPEEVLKWVLAPERVGPQVMTYYSKGVNEPALAAAEFAARPVSLRERRQGIAVLSRLLPNRQPIVVVLKKDMAKKDAPFLLDWETYLQEKEGLLPRFAADSSEREGTFRVILLRQHLFNEDDVSLGRIGLTIGTLSGIRLESPVIIGPSEKVYDRLERQLPWNRPQPATVRLAWSRFSSGEPPRLTIKEFLCWELAGVGGVPEGPLTPASPLAGAR